MNTIVCTNHGQDVVVYQGEYNSTCPFCQANIVIEDLNQKIEDLESELDGAIEDLENLKGEQ